MPGSESNTLDLIASTLLHTCGRVIEVSKDLATGRVWTNGGDLPVSDAAIIARCAHQIAGCFATRESDKVKYTATDDDTIHTYSVRIIAAHPDKELVFVTIESLSVKKEGVVAEDKWKLALDASGDGVWDANPATGAITFSDKWYEIFGYSPKEIATSADWGSKIHPDDLGHALAKSADYYAGKIPNYQIEIRYRCKDGSYKWILSRGVVIARTDDGRPLRFIGTHTDINDIKRAEEKHNTTQQLLETLIDNLRDGIIVSDETGKILFVNQTYCDIYGIDRFPYDMKDRDLDNNVTRRKRMLKSPEHFASRIKETRQARQPVLNEELQFADGRIFSRDYLPISLGTGYNGEIWKLTDVTDAKNTEQRFEAQRLFYERILNRIAAHIVVFDAQQRYVFANPEAIKNDELRKWIIGKTDRDYCAYRNKPMEIAEKRAEIFNKARDERRHIEWTEQLVAPDGSEEYHLRNMYPLFNGQGEFEMAIGYGLNITDRVVAEQELKTSRDTFSAAFNYSGIGMALLSPEGKWVDVNKVICYITRYTKEELLQLTFQDITYPDDLDVDVGLVKQMLKREISNYSLEKRYITKDNRIIWVLLTVSLVCNSDGTPRFFIAQVVDITRRKELADENSRKNMELEATRASLIERINQMDALNHIVAHNLRGPVGNINMLSTALIAHQKGGQFAEDNPLSSAFTLEEGLHHIEDNSAALMESLATLLEVTQIKLNHDIQYDDCNVAEMVKGIENQLQALIYEKHAQINIAAGLPIVHYPKIYLESIFYNFISNALKYSSHSRNPVIDISTAMVNDKVQLTVKDNGLGIDMEKYGKKLFKLNQIFHEGYDSKGVGLYITKTQVESLGGNIKVKSAPDAGAEFTVTL